MSVLLQAMWNAMEAQSSYSVRSVKRMQLKIDLESLRHFDDGHDHKIAVFLRPVRQEIPAVVWEAFKICADLQNGG